MHERLGTITSKREKCRRRGRAGHRASVLAIACTHGVSVNEMTQFARMPQGYQGRNFAISKNTSTAMAPPAAASHLRRFGAIPGAAGNEFQGILESPVGCVEGMVCRASMDERMRWFAEVTKIVPLEMTGAVKAFCGVCGGGVFRASAAATLSGCFLVGGSCGARVGFVRFCTGIRAVTTSADSACVATRGSDGMSGRALECGGK